MSLFKFIGREAELRGLFSNAYTVGHENTSDRIAAELC